MAPFSNSNSNSV